MINLEKKTLLVIAPHADDEVIGCAGIIQKIKNRNGKVYVLFLTNGNTKDFSTHGASNAEERIGEIKKVATFLGIDGWKIVFPGDTYHLRLDQLSQKTIIHEIERGEGISLETISPDILAFPMLNDYNQDHRAAAEAAFAACRPAPSKEKCIPNLILSYEGPHSIWTQTSPQPINAVLELSKEEAHKKTAVMELYESQLRGPGHPRHIDVLQALMSLRGSLVGTPFAEAFYCHKIHVN